MALSDQATAAARAAGLDEEQVRVLARPPGATGEFAADAAAFGAYWAQLDGAAAQLAAGGGDAALLREAGCETREAFLDRHAEALYRRLTDDYRAFVRVEDLVPGAARVVPGLVPDAAALADEGARRLADKIGVELQQGILLSKLAALPGPGTHLCHAMLLPLGDSGEALARFRRDGRLDLGRARLDRQGDAAVVTMSQPERLNCEDDGTCRPLETAIDVALMDPDVKIGVLRGDEVSHSSHAGRRLFGSGINLTALYRGEISYLFYVARDLGAVNKMFRGIARPDRDPSETGGGTTEKLWIAAVEGFAIGGACQLLLVMDHVIAERGAYLTLPARKEGIIPGMANLRLPRFVGDRLARQAILNERRIECDSPEGRLICDEIVEPGGMDAAIARTVEGLAGSGVVSAAGNRRALRVGLEPLDLFRQYLAVYAREQAHCHLSPALVANLERYWRDRQRAAH